VGTVQQAQHHTVAHTHHGPWTCRTRLFVVCCRGPTRLNHENVTNRNTVQDYGTSLPNHVTHVNVVEKAQSSSQKLPAAPHPPPPTPPPRSPPPPLRITSSYVTRHYHIRFKNTSKHSACNAAVYLVALQSLTPVPSQSQRRCTEAWIVYACFHPHLTVNHITIKQEDSASQQPPRPQSSDPQTLHQVCSQLVSCSANFPVTSQCSGRVSKYCATGIGTP
jgi:hypothetical protein